LVKFYTDRILIVIVLLYFTENAVKVSKLCIGCSSCVEILCPALFVH